jgi:hypothetical protein
MEIFTLNIFDSSFEFVLCSYEFFLVSTYKHEIRNCLFYYLFYLLDDQLLSLQVKQISIAHLNHFLLLNEKNKKCCIQI